VGLRLHQLSAAHVRIASPIVRLYLTNVEGERPTTADRKKPLTQWTRIHTNLKSTGAPANHPPSLRYGAAGANKRESSVSFTSFAGEF
jgi:hypothetical protein